MEGGQFQQQNLFSGGPAWLLLLVTGGQITYDRTFYLHAFICSAKWSLAVGGESICDCIILCEFLSATTSSGS